MNRTDPMSGHSGGFDHTKVHDDEIRSLYSRVLSLGDRTSAILRDTYGPQNLPIETCFTNYEEFNASVGIDDGRYRIEISRPVPILTRVLFDRLMMSPDLLSWLPSEDGEKELPRYELPFVVDPVRFDKRENWHVTLNPIRSFAAGTLGDICLCFITLHEFGHILSGHAEGVRHFYGENSFAEFAPASSKRLAEQERDQAWECDADAIASVLMLQYVKELAEDTQVNPRTAQLFQESDDHIAHALSLTVVSLFALFCYLSGLRYRLKRYGSHPHPIIRAHYVKDMLVTSARAQMDFDFGLFLELMDQRLEEMMTALQENALFDATQFSEDYVSSVNNRLDELKSSQAYFRCTCAKWAWIDWEATS